MAPRPNDLCKDHQRPPPYVLDVISSLVNAVDLLSTLVNGRFRPILATHISIYTHPAVRLYGHEILPIASTVSPFVMRNWVLDSKGYVTMILVALPACYRQHAVRKSRRKLFLRENTSFFLLLLLLSSYKLYMYSTQCWMIWLYVYLNLQNCRKVYYITVHIFLNDIIYSPLLIFCYLNTSFKY